MEHKKDSGNLKQRRLRIAAGLLAVLIVCGVVIGVLYSRGGVPGDGRPRIVCIGDSLTYGSGVRETRETDAWPQVLERKLDGAYEVLNYGISGATAQKSGDYPYNSKLWRQAKRCRGQIYILMLGSNDTKPQNWNAEGVADQLGQRVRELKRIPSAETVYLMIPPPVYKLSEEDEYAVYNIDGDRIRDELQDIVRNVAEENDVALIDLFTLLDGHPEYMVDGAHPGLEGNEIIAEHIAQVIRGEASE